MDLHPTSCFALWNLQLCTAWCIKDQEHENRAERAPYGGRGSPQGQGSRLLTKGPKQETWGKYSTGLCTILPDKTLAGQVRSAEKSFFGLLAFTVLHLGSSNG